jgi:hypothetical protein
MKTAARTKRKPRRARRIKNLLLRQQPLYVRQLGILDTSSGRSEDSIVAEQDELEMEQRTWLKSANGDDKPLPAIAIESRLGPILFVEKIYWGFWGRRKFHDILVRGTVTPQRICYLLCRGPCS